jgi:hypothetical protein
MISGVGSFNPDHRAPGSLADCPPDFGSLVLPEYDSVPDFKTPEGSHGGRWINALIRDDQSGYHDDGDHTPSDTGDGLEFPSSVERSRVQRRRASAVRCNARLDVVGMPPLQIIKKLRARLLDQPKVRFLPTEEFGQEGRLPEMIVLGRRHTVQLAIEPNKLDRNVLIPVVSKTDELSKSRDHGRPVMKHALEDRPDGIAGQLAGMMLIEQSGAAFANGGGFSPAVVGADQIEMSTMTDLTLQLVV